MMINYTRLIKREIVKETDEVSEDRYDGDMRQI